MHDPSGLTHSTPESFGCMEVWGGACDGDRYITRPGLDVWVVGRRPHGSRAGLQFVTSCASGRITRVLLAELVSVPSVFARCAAALRRVLKRNINKVQQAACEQAVGRLMGDCANHGGCGSTLLATYFSPTRRLTVCNAGHPPPLIYRSAESRWSVLAGRAAGAAASPSEAVTDPAEFQHASVQLGGSDMVLFYSESLLECRTAAGMPLGVSSLVDRVRALDAAAPQSLAGELLRRIEREHDGNLAEADVSVVLCRRSDRGAGWTNTLLAPLRLLGPVADRTNL